MGCIVGFVLAVLGVSYSAVVSYPVVWHFCPTCRPRLCLGVGFSLGADGYICHGFSARTFAESLLYVPAGIVLGGMFLWIQCIFGRCSVGLASQWLRPAAM